MIKGLVVSAAVFVGLAGLADRGCAALAGSAVGESIQRSEGLAEKPEVTFRGFPFLTQAIQGKFDEIDVEARDVIVDTLTFSTIDADLRGVEVGVKDALSGEIEAVPVRSGTSIVTLTYAELNEFLDSRPGSPRVSTGPDGTLLVRSTVGVPGRGSVPVEGMGVPSVTAGGIVVKVTGIRAVSGPALPATVAAASSGRLSFTIPTGGMPFGITVREVSVEPDALRFGATAKGVIIRAR